MPHGIISGITLTMLCDIASTKDYDSHEWKARCKVLGPMHMSSRSIGHCMTVSTNSRTVADAWESNGHTDWRM